MKLHDSWRAKLDYALSNTEVTQKAIVLLVRLEWAFWDVVSETTENYMIIFDTSRGRDHRTALSVTCIPGCLPDANVLSVQSAH